MNKLKLTTKQLEKIFFENSERFSVMEKGSWESEGKFETTTFVFKDNQTGTYYEGYVGRSGDYWSDYVYDSEYGNVEDIIYPVEEKEVVVKKWGSVNKEDVTGEIDMTGKDI